MLDDTYLEPNIVGNSYLEHDILVTAICSPKILVQSYFETEKNGSLRFGVPKNWVTAT